MSQAEHRSTMNLSAENAIRAEIAAADLSMAVDGSFVETSSSHAARELKKRLDQLIGVGKNGVRSPYALTITQGTSGSRVYRVGFRPSAPDGHPIDSNVMSPTTADMPRHDGPGGLLSPLTAINSSSSAGLHQRAATRSHDSVCLLPVPASGYRTVVRTRSGSISTSRPSTSTWDVEAEKIPLPEDTDNPGSSPVATLTDAVQRPRTYAGSQYFRLENTDLQIYSRTGDSDIFSSAMGWSDSPRDVTRDPRPISERPFLQLEPGAFPFGRGVLYTKPPSGAIAGEIRRSSLDQPNSDTPASDAQTDDDLNDHPQPKDTSSGTISTLIKYPTGVFQVLQTYRGLPTLDVLLESYDTPTAKLSTTTSAVPENDPRFVIFGDVKPAADTITTVGRRKITKPKPNAATLSVHSDGIGSSEQRVMMAATIERWVAQLTSELNYDALLDFFLTYRAYVSANDLCHLLICRFHWALEPTSSAQDETVRRIVRVRTFIAFRYWLSTFFQVDFLPNRVLRNEFTSWLNALRKNPMLTAKPDAVIIVQKLKKIVRECKEAHVPKPDTKSPQSPIERTPAEATPLNLHALRTAFEPKLPPVPAGENDSDVDLVATPIVDPLTAVASPRSTPASPPRKSSLALPFPRSDVHSPRASSSLMPMSMPMHHGPLTRAFVNTMGRIGRWKRGIGARSTMGVAVAVGTAGCVDSNAFDNELGLGMGMAAEVVAVRGGVEEYLKMCGLVGGQTGLGLVGEEGSDGDAEVGEADGEGSDGDGLDAEAGNDLTVMPGRISDLEEQGKGRDTPTSTATPRLGSQFPPEAEVTFKATDEVETETGSLRHSRRASDATQMQLYVDTLRDSWLPEHETISIDDADLSDSSSESEIVRRAPRRLPNRRDFEFATGRTDSVSSLAAPSSVPSVQSVLSASDPTTPDQTQTNGAIQSWQIDFLGEDSDDEGVAPGDAEAALQRLEGQIDAEEQRQRDLKVDKWLKRVQELSLLQKGSGVGVMDLAALGISFDDEDEEGDDGDAGTIEGEDVGATAVVAEIEAEAEEEATPSVDGPMERESVAVSSQVAEPSVPPSASSTRPSRASVRPSIEISSETNGSSARLLGSNISPLADSMHDVPSSRQRPPKQIKKGRAAKDTSFLLQHRSEVIAHNFSAIERGLFMGISFEELVMHNWGPQSHDLDVTDWMQYRTDAAQHRIQPKVQKEGGKDVLTSDVLAVRARFNLTVNFVASEIVLAHASQRVPVFSKLVRIAWKLYQMNNFATLASIITGLDSVWVDAAMKRLWPNVGIWEMRLLRDLRYFTSSTDHFRFMRNAVSSATHDNRIDTTGTPSERGPEQPLARCIPFLGIYLSELSEYAKLPDFIDPTRPEEPIRLDPATGEFGPLHDPETFNTLPEQPDYMPLRPLLNLHKQRQIAGVVKALVSGQHMASGCQFTVEQKVYSKCLRLKCVDGPTLWRALAAE